MHIAVVFCLHLFLVLHTTSAGKKELDAFKEGWPLGSDLNCIHRDVQQLGAAIIRAKPNEPSYQGFRTYCFFLQEIAHTVRIYKWPDFQEVPLAVVFVTGKPPNLPVYKEGQKIDACESFVDLKSTRQPSWIASKDSREVERKLGSHCFFNTYEDNFSYKTVFKFSYHRPTGTKSGYFESKVLFFLVPNKNDYLITNNERDLDKLCTRCNAGGGFAQLSTLKGSNLTSLLQATSNLNKGTKE